MAKTYQIIGIGNAIVDILAPCEDIFLTQNSIQKGIMQLIDTDRAQHLYRLMDNTREISGGSAANTIAGLGQLGLRVAYVGKVKDDALGRNYAKDLRAQGVDFQTPKSPTDVKMATGRSMILITPDGERSMNTYLGVSEHIAPADIDTAQMADTDWIYLEGYRFDGPDSHAAFAVAISACKAAGGRVSLTLSDPFCVERHFDAFHKIIEQHVDALFCNEHELVALYGGDLQGAMDKAAEKTALVACTIGAGGVIVASGARRMSVAVEPVTVVDLTGAGDLFAAGFLAGLARDKPLEVCAKMGNMAAAAVIGHIGARVSADLQKILEW